ncbi:hypothetical protein MVLG_00287 [Microbotryum lychnidis-dioicae p1A1 Lamole]|uniref:BZIP domain-containing protein n=1 Tax=Microbotryum lychnidis-dioicae (strain p1A1 Lamole / MvSl-1064) TaxID=683840 RepID=U5GYM2_USTV1|nr:hypothetical protein MVLG_00287 [Microbotryum lychnidis-dioicae p1A1 Lamole]|eukprot:KDE09381.1 hypothetical protein MVLG_00287 [Microbotryum lychnidis-dioicae p1A1 Lamole]
MSTIDWSNLNLTAGNLPLGDDQDNYIAKLLSLNPNLPYSGQNLGVLSSPEASESASPESDAAPSSRQSSTGAPSFETSKASAAPVKMSPTRATALAQHEKRKASDSKSSTAALKDRRASTTGSGTISNRGAEESHHTHPDDEDIENDSDDDGKGGKGHKTTDKRKDQNRKAQRAFRERKEKHLKDLEDRVLSLEQESSAKAAENAALKQLMERLQDENERLKVYETAFSFSYAKDVSNSATMSSAPQFKPPTPPTDQDDLTRTSAFASPASTSSVPLSETSNPFDANGFLTSNLPTSAPVFNTSPSAFALPQQSSYPQHPSGSSSASPLGFSPPTYDATNRQLSLDEQIFLGSLSSGASPASTLAGSSSASGASTRMSSLPGMSTTDLFTAYRDSFGTTDLTSLTEFDALFNTSGLSTGLSPAPGAPGTTSTPDDLLAAFVKSPSPVVSASLPTAETSLSEGPTTSECPFITPGAKYEFDVDGLCAEMKLKATCQEKAREALRSAMAADANAVAKAYPQQQ